MPAIEDCYPLRPQTIWMQHGYARDRHHTPPQEFTLLDDGNESKALVNWKITNERDKNVWANQDDATRDGAYAFALAATELLRGLVAIRRAETRTGADYYIAPLGQEVEDLEGCFRLEVSGTNLGVSEIKRRLREKVDQALQGDSNLPDARLCSWIPR